MAPRQKGRGGAAATPAAPPLSRDATQQEFHAYYADIYKERYAALFEALAAPAQCAALLNTLAPPGGELLLEEEGLDLLLACQTSCLYRCVVFVFVCVLLCVYVC